MRKTTHTKSSDREQDGLNGPVRRVRVETSKIVVKDGTPTEGPRVVRGITTYDINGHKIDSVAHPVEGSAPIGKEQYRYDNKGNITEMVVRADDGSILSKEIYQYEFDELGNWRKMTTSVAVYENGTLSVEPVEVTFRMITYYYANAINKIMASTSQPSSVSAPSPPLISRERISGLQSTGTVTAAGESTTNNKETATVAVHRTDNSISGNKTASIPSSSLPDNITAAKNGSKAAETASASFETPPVSPGNVPLNHISEAALRTAAILLPQPELPSAAELNGQNGRVEVQIVIDEQGRVTNVKGASANQLLNKAAEAAALKARFSPVKLSPTPARLLGVITYYFAPSSKSMPAVLPSSQSAMKNQVATVPKREESNSNSHTVALSGTNSDASSVVPRAPSSEESGLFYKEGLTYLTARRYTEAVGALRRAVLRDPQDALAYIKLGLAYSALGQDKETIAALKVAIRLNTQLVGAEDFYRLGEAYTGLGKHSEALEAFQQAMYSTRAQAESDGSEIRQSPTLAELHYGLGLAYNNLSRQKAAVEELKQAIILDPGFAKAYFGLALAYIGLGDWNSAQKQERVLRSLSTSLADQLAGVFAKVRNVTAATHTGVTIVIGRRP
ncbi:MAG: TonB family protein [bacterium]